MSIIEEFHIGFTGSREEPSDSQKFALKDTLARFREEHPMDELFFHHGDCVGSDEAAANIAHDLGYRIVNHPPTNPKLRAYFDGDTVLPEKEYLDRNRDIVDASAVILATPSKPRSGGGGTWYTVTYAEKQETPVYLFPQS